MKRIDSECSFFSIEDGQFRVITLEFLLQLPATVALVGTSMSTFSLLLDVLNVTSNCMDACNLMQGSFRVQLPTLFGNAGGEGFAVVVVVVGVVDDEVVGGTEVVVVGFSVGLDLVEEVEFGVT